MSVDQLRLKILDKPQVVLGERLGRGDEETKTFKFKSRPIPEKPVTIYFNGETNTLFSNAIKRNVDECKYDSDNNELTIKFKGPLTGVLVTADYQFAAFSDSELEHFLTEAGNCVPLAAGNALDALLGDRQKLETWARVDSRVDFKMLRRDIADVAQKFKNQAMEESNANDDL